MQTSVFKEILDRSISFDKLNGNLQTGTVPDSYAPQQMYISSLLAPKDESLPYPGAVIKIDGPGASVGSRSEIASIKSVLIKASNSISLWDGGSYTFQMSQIVNENGGSNNYGTLNLFQSSDSGADAVAKITSGPLSFIGQALLVGSKTTSVTGFSLIVAGGGLYANLCSFSNTTYRTGGVAAFLSGSYIRMSWGSDLTFYPHDSSHQVSLNYFYFTEFGLTQSQASTLYITKHLGNLTAGQTDRLIAIDQDLAKTNSPTFASLDLTGAGLTLYSGLNATLQLFAGGDVVCRRILIPDGLSGSPIITATTGPTGVISSSSAITSQGVVTGASLVATLGGQISSSTGDITTGGNIWAAYNGNIYTTGSSTNTGNITANGHGSVFVTGSGSIAANTGNVSSITGDLISYGGNVQVYKELRPANGSALGTVSTATSGGGSYYKITLSRTSNIYVVNSGSVPTGVVVGRSIVAIDNAVGFNIGHQIKLVRPQGASGTLHIEHNTDYTSTGWNKFWTKTTLSLLFDASNSSYDFYFDGTYWVQC